VLNKYCGTIKRHWKGCHTLQGRGGRGELLQATPPRRGPRRPGSAPHGAQPPPRWPPAPGPNPILRVPIPPGAGGKASETGSLGESSVAGTAGTGATETEGEGFLVPSPGTPAAASVSEAVGGSGGPSGGSTGRGSGSQRSSLSLCLYYLRTGECKFGNA